MTNIHHKVKSFISRGFICLVVLIATTAGVFSQISYGGRSIGLTARRENIPVVTMPRFDVQKYLLETELKRMNGPNLKSMVFAKPFIVNLEPSRDGIWETLEGGMRVWRIALQSTGAHSLNIIFSSFSLEDGVSVFVYNPDGSHTLGAFDRRNNNISGSLAISPINGDKLIVEMQVRPDVENFGELVIGRLNHDFTGVFAKNFSVSGECNIDINCPPGTPWQKHKNSVVRLLINGNVLCSGVLVNNTSNDGRPLMMTAGHCVSDSASAANTTILFGYESPFCNGGKGSSINSLSGANLLSTQPNLDFSLMELREMPPPSYRPWYSGWDRSDDRPASTVSIHHPQGDVKKIAIDRDPPSTTTYVGFTANGHWRVKRWEFGTTEPGSSGSPLFDQDGYLTGVLTGGDARCGNPTDDYYAKFSHAWERYPEETKQLVVWLDPENKGDIRLQGLNPYQGGVLSADFTISSTTICIGDELVFTDFSSGDPESWFWDFGEGADPPTASGRGPHLVRYSSGGIVTTSLTVSNTVSSRYREETFTLDVKTSQLPVAGFTYTETQYSVQFHDLSENATRYYWEFGNQNTSTTREPVHNYSRVPDREYMVSQLVRNQACMDTSVQVIMVTSLPGYDDSKEEELKVYPVPANRVINIENPRPFPANTVAELFSIGGQSLVRMQIKEGENFLTIPVDKYPPGSYILLITIGNDIYRLKLPVVR